MASSPSRASLSLLNGSAIHVFRKDHFGETPKPTRETRALPRQYRNASENRERIDSVWTLARYFVGCYAALNKKSPNNFCSSVQSFSKRRPAVAAIEIIS